MIWATTIAALEEPGVEYILVTRERGDVRVRRIVLENEKPLCCSCSSARAARSSSS